MTSHLRRVKTLLVLMALAVIFAQRTRTQAAETATPAARAIAYLAVEVPKWSREQHCFSCHNNGDAARALMAAVKSGDLLDRAPLADTLEFLARPERWDDNGPEGPFKDKKLARIQFAQALAAANQTEVLKDTGALAKAAALVAEMQLADGSWESDAPGNIGSPATYGRHLATALAARVLSQSDPAKHQEAIAKARLWFEKTPAKSVLDAAATLLALAGSTVPSQRAEHQRCLTLVRGAQSPEGGWGPFVTSPAEVFDTALVLLALEPLPEKQELAPAIERGRRYLIASQLADGSWPATTRPSGAESYAQQLSATGWATQALLATRERGHKP